jgi:hypothetical protein
MVSINRQLGSKREQTYIAYYARVSYGRPSLAGSRASAAALSAVLRTTTLSYGKNAIFRPLPSRNPSTDHDEILND